MKIYKIGMILLMLISSLSGRAAEFSIIRQYANPITAVSTSSDNTTINRVNTGTGVVIKKGFVLTAAHIVKDMTSVYIQINAITYRLNVIKIDDILDIALLSGNIDCPCANIKLSNPEVDDPTFAVGYPYYSLYQAQIVTTGNVQGYQGHQLISTANISSGASGGGVFTKVGNNYELVGIISSMASVPVGPRQLNINIPITWINFNVSASTINAFISNTLYDQITRE